MADLTTLTKGKRNLIVVGIGNIIFGVGNFVALIASGLFEYVHSRAYGWLWAELTWSIVSGAVAIGSGTIIPHGNYHRWMYVNIGCGMVAIFLTSFNMETARVMLTKYYYGAIFNIVYNNRIQPAAAISGCVLILLQLMANICQVTIAIKLRKHTPAQHDSPGILLNVVASRVPQLVLPPPRQGSAVPQPVRGVGRRGA
jgi:hypothetical protein